jgi:hypothetical protein
MNPDAAALDNTVQPPTPNSPPPSHKDRMDGPRSQEPLLISKLYSKAATLDIPLSADPDKPYHAKLALTAEISHPEA